MIEIMLQPLFDESYLEIKTSTLTIIDKLWFILVSRINLIRVI